MIRRNQISDLWFSLIGGSNGVDGPRAMNYMPLSTLAMRLCAIIVLGGLAVLFAFSSGTTFLEAIQSVSHGEMSLAVFAEHYWLLGLLLVLAMPFRLARIYLPVYMVAVITIEAWGIPMSAVASFVSHHMRPLTLLVFLCALSLLPRRTSSETEAP